jgi:hypothetical protein
MKQSSPLNSVDPRLAAIFNTRLADKDPKEVAKCLVHHLNKGKSRERAMADTLEDFKLSGAN